MVKRIFLYSFLSLLIILVFSSCSTGKKKLVLPEIDEMLTRNDTLTWEDTNPDDDTYYEVWIGTDPKNMICYTTTCRNKYNFFLKNNREYFWKIIKVVEDGNRIESQIKSFHTLTNLPPIVEKIEGPSGITGDNVIFFSWKGSDQDGYVDHFEFRLNNLEWKETNNSQYTWNDFSKGENCFEVKAVDNDFDYSESVIWKFESINNEIEILDVCFSSIYRYFSNGDVLMESDMKIYLKNSYQRDIMKQRFKTNEDMRKEDFKKTLNNYENKLGREIKAKDFNWSVILENDNTIIVKEVTLISGFTGYEDMNFNTSLLDTHLYLENENFLKIILPKNSKIISITPEPTSKVDEHTFLWKNTGKITFPEIKYSLENCK